MTLTQKPLCAAIALSMGLLTPALSHADEAALRAQLQQMEQQLQLLKQQLETIRQQTEQVNQKVEAVASQQETVSASRTGAPSAGTIPAANNAEDLANNSTAQGTPTTDGSRMAAQTALLANGQTSIFGYGEVTYTRPRKNNAGTQFDVNRAVLGIGHRFNDRLKLVTEFEFEHAVTSKDDRGEVAVEQLYLDYQINQSVNTKAGLFLIPLGFLNEVHEPDRFYGVFRNEVETRIIPTTWREGGAAVYGQLENGIYYDAGVTTGFNISKWNAGESPASPLASVHQEGQLANARDLAVYGAVRYVGIPGVRVGAGVWSGNSTQGNTAFKSGSSALDFMNLNGRISVGEMHAAWTSGPWDVRALYAQVLINQARELNDVLASPAGGFTGGFIPKRADGAYLQAAYKFSLPQGLSLAPFVRLERFNTQKDMPAGYDALRTPLTADNVATAGASLYLSRSAVLKADVQRYRNDKNKDRFNVGLGYSF